MKAKQIVIIGGGPGGYVAAIRAAQLGAEVTLIEKERMGGTCLNAGCIPTKALLESSHTFQRAGHSEELGVTAKPTLVWEKVQERRQKVVDRLVNGVESLMRANKIQVVKGKASFVDAHMVNVSDGDGNTQEISGDSFIIATGSVPVRPPVIGMEKEFCVDSSQVLKLEKIPKSMLVVGGGVVGLELATAYHEFGAKVIIVEMASEILPNMDRELSEKLRKDLQRRGIEVFTESKVCALEEGSGNVLCYVEAEGKKLEFQVEKVLISAGRKANLDGLQLEKAGVKYGRVIETDAQMRTNVPHIYAIGDCNGKQMLAHAASEQGVVAAENCMGKSRSYDGSVCPSGVYSAPELAGVGLTEETLKERGISYKKALFPMTANGRAIIMREDDGVVKVLAGEKYNEILGVHIYGAMATELIAEAALAMKLEATVDELIDTIHSHPTLNEGIHEAMLGIQRRMIHMPNR